MKHLKKCHKSKTMRLAAILAITATTLEYFPILKAFLGENYQPALFVLSVTVAVLRFYTDRPLAEK